MFGWSRRQPPQHETGSTADPAAVLDRHAIVDDHALEALVQVLRAFGGCAFDLGDEGLAAFSGRCAAWAQHLLNLTPPPTGVPTSSIDHEMSADGSGTMAVGRRDWATVVQFFVARRRREQQYVTRALGDLRQSLWAFAQSIGTVLMEDQQADDRLQSQIDRLKVALERLSPDDLRAEVMAAASNLSTLVGERQRRQRERLEALGAKVADLSSQLREAREEGIRDPLTLLANRKGFDEFVNRMVFMRDVFAETACLLMIDVDRFKLVNDKFGHAAGDDVLKALADCLVRNFPRKSDLVARYGGEELAIVLPATSPPDACRLAKRMLTTIRALEVRHNDQSISITVSVGIGQLGRSESIQGWLERVDRALYRAKAEGRDRIVEAASADEL